MPLADILDRLVPTLVRARLPPGARVAIRKRVGSSGLREFERDFAELYLRCAPFTMTPPVRMYATWRSIRYVATERIPGDVVECGVWRGGHTMLAALVLKQLGDESRTIHLYDTFAGMTEPTVEDGLLAVQQWQPQQRGKHNEWCYAPLRDVQANMASTGYPNVTYVEGKIEETVPRCLPDRISLLRLDTDWYESTKHELEYLYPLLSPGGVVILDDYGNWIGSRRAADEYFETLDDRPLLHRTDATGYIGVKP